MGNETDFNVIINSFQQCFFKPCFIVSLPVDSKYNAFLAISYYTF